MVAQTRSNDRNWISITRSPNPQPKCTVLKLPSEILQMIITYALPENDQIKYQVTRTHHKRVFSTTRLTISVMGSTYLTMYMEIKSIEDCFYKLNAFHVDDLYSGYFWLERLSMRNLAAIHTLSPTLEDSNYGINMVNLLRKVRNLTIDISALVSEFPFEKITVSRGPTLTLTQLFQSLIPNNDAFPHMRNPSSQLNFLLAMEPVQEVRVTMTKTLERANEQLQSMVREREWSAMAGPYVAPV
ncbi:hypothetical protein BKA65DRAFT_486172 [Rhexocercosporidium sp. MPI-PUGE-AT-0058]|nr:hypothetical protein BKA65DRAFT_486172 [Rhexocercosporidium sp. MPI-PUGE-AT-0058]